MTESHVARRFRGSCGILQGESHDVAALRRLRSSGSEIDLSRCYKGSKEEQGNSDAHDEFRHAKESYLLISLLYRAKNVTFWKRRTSLIVRVCRAGGFRRA